MYSLSKNRNTYKIMRTKRRKVKGWIISSNSYMDLEKIAINLMNDIPKIHLKRIDLTNISSSIKNSIKEDIDANLSRNEVLDESTEESNQQNIDASLPINEVLDESIEKSNQQDIDASLLNAVLNESTEKSNQQDIDNLSRNEVPDESTDKSNQQDVQPNISNTNLCDTLFEHFLVNDKTANIGLNINFYINEILNICLNILTTEKNGQNDKVTKINNPDVNNIQNKSTELEKTTVNQQEDIYENSKDYNNDPDYDDSNNSENSDDESNVSSVVSQSFNQNEKSNTTNSSLDISKYEGKASCDDTNLIVPQAKGTNKKYFCMYCKKLQAQLPRHLENVHKNEAQVKKFILLPKGNSKRKAIIETIRKESNFIYNTSSQYNTGELIVSRRSSKANKPASNFICCPKCKGYYSKNTLRYHFRNCNKSSSGRHIMVLARKLQARIHTKACDMVRKVIFPILRDDDVCKIIRYDELVILHANKLCKKFRNHSMIRAELRLLGRYLISIKKFNSNITDFASIYQPRHYDSCILATKDVAQFDPDTNKFKTLSVAIRLGTLLKELGNLLVTEYIKRDNNEGLKNVYNFLKLLQKNYGKAINKIAKCKLS